MAQLAFKYSADQLHQTEAVNAVCDLFRGQEFLSSEFVAAMGGRGTFEEGQVVSVGYGNGLHLSSNQILNNLHAIQERNCLAPSSDLTDGRLRDFTVEMETGTGKTYVYTRTIYELNKRYGLTKFVIVVPSVPIREGVKKSFESTKAHFDGLYDHKPLYSFLYDSKDMDSVNNFALSNSIQVMIINISAFNKEIDSDEAKGKPNIFHRPSEKTIGGHSPQELVSSCNPIVIIDEPQSVDNTDKAKKAIKSLNPMFVLRYSATHKQVLNKVYSLGPVEAFQQNLVKGIVVDSATSGDDMNGAYVCLESTKKDASGYSAKLTIDVLQPRTATQKRKAVTVRAGDDLYQKSKENTDYVDGWIVTNIGTERGDEFVEFLNGTYLELKGKVGDVAADAVRQAQIVKMIEDHLERQLKLYHQGIKVLSLVFIDKVSKYRQYEPTVCNGAYAEYFEAKYREIATSDKWQRRYARANVPLPVEPGPLHQGYFAQDGKGKFKDSRGDAITAADTSAFETIMQSKEDLVSFPSDSDTPEQHAKRQVQFIWSHSALKEGWDNPNIFQICTLVETNDPLTKRQKIGRGLRLPVNQQGERSFDPDVNLLTVISNESYDKFAKDLQAEYEEDGCKFGILTAESFTNLIIRKPNGDEEKVGYAASKTIYDGLAATGLVSSKGAITPELKLAAEAAEVPLPEELVDVEGVQEQVSQLILHRSEKLKIRDKGKEVTVELDKDVSNDPAFQQLWERIRQTTRFEMNIDTEKLVEKAIEGISHMPPIRPVEVTSVQARLSVGDAGVSVDEDSIRNSIVKTDTYRAYDLPDPLAELQDAVGLTRATLKRILEECGRFDEFKIDPMTFLSQVAAKLVIAKNDVVTDGIKYTKLPESDWYTMDILAVDDLKAYLDQNAWEPSNRKSLYNYVVFDSSTIEQPYAVALDQADMVKVFAKLPSRFKIDTPLGSYNPDWAYVEEVDGRQRVFFVMETKGKARGENRPTEEAKITCAEKHFKALGLGDDFMYDVETTYHYAMI